MMRITVIDHSLHVGDHVTAREDYCRVEEVSETTIGLGPPKRWFMIKVVVRNAYRRVQRKMLQIFL